MEHRLVTPSPGWGGGGESGTQVYSPDRVILNI